MDRILLVDDHQEIFNLVLESTSKLASLTWVKTIKEAQSVLQLEEPFDLLILDIDLPDGNGIEYCSVIQSLYPKLLVFILTDHQTIAEKVLGFSAGADDYITKPFAPLELRARLESRLKKNRQHLLDNDNEMWKELKICKSRQEVSILVENIFKKIDLTSLEFKILFYLSKHLGEVVARDQLLNEIWGKDVHVYQRSVDTHISKLRKKLGPVSYILKSIHGIGYKFYPTYV
jgi:DNA-binding response OmpR family regulator